MVPTLTVLPTIRPYVVHVFFFFSFPGRLDRKIELPNPDQEARARIMQIHSRKMNVRLDNLFK